MGYLYFLINNKKCLFFATRGVFYWCFRRAIYTNIQSNITNNTITEVQAGFSRSVADAMISLIQTGSDRTVIENAFGPTSNIIQTPQIEEIMKTFISHADLLDKTTTTFKNILPVISSNTDAITGITTPTIPDQEWINNFKQLCLNKMNLDTRVNSGRLPIENADLYKAILDEVCRLIQSGHSNDYIVNNLVPNNKVASGEIWSICSTFLQETRKLDNSTISVIEAVTPLVNPLENLTSLVDNIATEATVKTPNIISNWNNICN